MQAAQILKSASFRLAAAYVALFSLSVGILVGLIYFSTTSEFQSELCTLMDSQPMDTLKTTNPWQSLHVLMFFNGLENERKPSLDSQPRLVLVGHLT